MGEERFLSFRKPKCYFGSRNYPFIIPLGTTLAHNKEQRGELVEILLEKLDKKRPNSRHQVLRGNADGLGVVASISLPSAVQTNFLLKKELGQSPENFEFSVFLAAPEKLRFEILTRLMTHIRIVQIEQHSPNELSGRQPAKT